MANYKPQKLDYISVAGFNKFIPAGAKPKILYWPHAGNAGPKSFKDSDPDTIYTVATGKKFYAVAVEILFSATGISLYQIHSGDTEDAQTLQKIYYDMNGISGQKLSFPTNFTIEAGKYVTGDPAGAVVRLGLCYGYEL